MPPERISIYKGERGIGKDNQKVAAEGVRENFFHRGRFFLSGHGGCSVKTLYRRVLSVCPFSILYRDFGEEMEKVYIRDYFVSIETVSCQVRIKRAHL
jgi:hypothetical protein